MLNGRQYVAVNHRAAYLHKAGALSRGILLLAPCQAGLTNMSAPPDHRKPLPVLLLAHGYTCTCGHIQSGTSVETDGMVLAPVVASTSNMRPKIRLIHFGESSLPTDDMQ